MKIILTHEQADFDALASLLGAHLVQEDAAPVLPRRLNRNVRAFITLYGVDMPFVDPRDLPKETIEVVTLVDTQSMVSVKGVDEETQIRVIDHHAARPDLSKNWQVTTDITGATTTLLVEAVEESDIRLSMVQATLLLLGIYEDTGGLTYTRTTSRDIRAAAYLVDQGANLQIVGDFLNHPLSHEQQAVYDDLRENIEIHPVHGYTVLVACADATNTDEELSTIAHKLRDVLDPDALALLIVTGGGVQLIARSTTDQINVSDLAARFGGGGHPRAAASLIRKRELEDIHAELLAALPEIVRPAVTVAEIMSRGPQLLAPETAVGEVAERMQRYGYEGYPVVENGKVVGLVTRRAVDRALGHKLNLKAKDVMEAGAAYITPQASIEDLQKVMTDTGWGQVPVTDPDTQEIIGIVTRTDLLKTLTPETKGNGHKNLAERLEQYLPPARLALLKAVASVAQRQHDAIYVVGGFVRDLLLERPSLDYDLVVEGDAIALGKALVKEFGGRVTTHKRFGTAKWQIAEIAEELAARLMVDAKTDLNPADFPETLDLVSARREFYTAPTALPTVERGSIKLDLHRRDFTINTLALRLDGRHYGELHDYWGGYADLQAGRVRVLHSLSFVDDPTRILRAIRFEQRFGYELGQRTQELLLNALPLLDRLSGDRLRHELNQILQEPNGTLMLNRLAELDILASIHEKITFGEKVQQRMALAGGEPPSEDWAIEQLSDDHPLALALTYMLWFMTLSSVEAASVAGRLKLPGWLAKNILAACKLNAETPALDPKTPSTAVELLEELPRLAVYAYYLNTRDKKAKKAIETYISTWQGIQPVTTGHDLRQKNIPPGPVYRQILDTLRAAWLDGKVSTKKQELALLKELLNDRP